MREVKQFTDEVSKWPEVSAHPHRFGGWEFRLASAEIGHVHAGGGVDIPFPRAMRDVLLAQGLAREHRWVPDSGWVSFQIRDQETLKHALWLMRLSYVRYVVRTAADPLDLIEQEKHALQLSAELTSLFQMLVTRSPGRIRPAQVTR